MSKKSVSKSGYLLKEENGAWHRLYLMLKSRELIFASQRNEEPLAVVDMEVWVNAENASIMSARLQDVGVSVPDGSRVSAQFPVLLAPQKSGAPLMFAAESKEEQESWLSAFAVAAVPHAWPGGYDFHRRPVPLLYSMWIARHTAPGTSARAFAAADTTRDDADAAGPTAEPAALAAARASAVKIPSPYPRYPLLEAVPAWQRKALLLRKLRLCSIIFDIGDENFSRDGEIHRNTLLEILDFVKGAGHILSDYRVLEDAITMIRLNLFRTLPVAPKPIGDPDEEEQIFMDPQWPHLSITYELLLHIVCSDAIDLSLKKKAIDASFVVHLMQLFDSEDPDERTMLKNVTHKIYSNLTQRRTLIRRVICNIFFEFILETEQHNGIGDVLQMLASIINGFAIPIKDEHRTMLQKAMLPLHKAKDIMGFHPQLAYCMALYVSKDHTLTRDVVPAVLRYFPFGNSQKQIMFLNELEDIFEYVLDEDLTVFREALVSRLSKCIACKHFQVAERTLLLWNSATFTSLMLVSPVNRSYILHGIFGALSDNQESHWHETIRTLSTITLNKYYEVDPALYAECKAENDIAVLQEAEAGMQDGLLSANGVPSTALMDVPPVTDAISVSPLNRNVGFGSPQGVGSPSSVTSLSSPPSGGSSSMPSPASAHAHKAPAVRASMSFAVTPTADLLPSGHHATPKRERHALALPMALPSSDVAIAEES